MTYLAKADRTYDWIDSLPRPGSWILPLLCNKTNNTWFFRGNMAYYFPSVWSDSLSVPLESILQYCPSNHVVLVYDFTPQLTNSAISLVNSADRYAFSLIIRGE